MKKFLRLIENIALGLFVNGSYSIMTDTLGMQNVLITAISLYVMAIVIIFQED